LAIVNATPSQGVLRKMEKMKGRKDNQLSIINATPNQGVWRKGEKKRGRKR